MPLGGKRPGAGRKPGFKFPATLEKAEAREAARRLITAHLKPLIQRQVVHAMGIGHLYTRDKAGKFTKVENQAQVDKLLTEGKQDEDFWIFTKDPSVQAFTDLMNRALDKPAEQPLQVQHTEDDRLLAILAAGRQHAKTQP